MNSKLYHISNADCSVEYIYISSSLDEVMDQMEEGETIDGIFAINPVHNNSSLPEDRRLGEEGKLSLYPHFRP
jgi:hypothetical protein